MHAQTHAKTHTHINTNTHEQTLNLHWVRALTVPMHLLGLINRPFVPCNLISVQYSPVPLAKFQMAPRLNTLMPSGSKKGTQIYYTFLSESPGKWIPSTFPSGAPMERDICLQDIFVSLNISLIIFPLRVPSKAAPSMFPNRVPMERNIPSPGSLVYLFIHSFMYVWLVPKNEPSYIRGET